MSPSEVIADIRFDGGLLFVDIVNIGAGPAFDVTVTFEPGFRGLGGSSEVSSLPVFRRLAFLAPGRRIEVFVDTAVAYFSRGEPEQLKAAVAYRDPQGQARKSVIRHDLSIYRSLPYVVREA